MEPLQQWLEQVVVDASRADVHFRIVLRRGSRSVLAGAAMVIGMHVEQDEGPRSATWSRRAPSASKNAS